MGRSIAVAIHILSVCVCTVYSRLVHTGFILLVVSYIHTARYHIQKSAGRVSTEPPLGRTRNPSKAPFYTIKLGHCYLWRFGGSVMTAHCTISQIPRLLRLSILYLLLELSKVDLLSGAPTMI